MFARISDRNLCLKINKVKYDSFNINIQDSAGREEDHNGKGRRHPNFAEDTQIGTSGSQVFNLNS